MTLDDDMAAALRRLQNARKARLRNLVNEALRRGIREMSARASSQPEFHSRTVALGRLRIASINNISEALASLEGEVST